MEAPSKTLLDHMNETTDKVQYMKFQAMQLYTVENLKAEQVAKIVGKKVDAIYQWAYRFKKFGIEGLINKPRGGRQWAYMSLDDERDLLNSLVDDASKGLVIISKIVRLKAEEKLGQSVSPDYAEDILNRHNWRKVAPRPKHPKSSKEDQEEFKKKSQSLSMKQLLHLTLKTIDQ